MTIRRTLLFAFLLAALLPAAGLTYFAFSQSGEALRAEIEQGLQVQAQTVSSDLDKMLFERLQNAATWNHLEVMQDIHVGDVDRRASAFLFELKLRYGEVYRDLDAMDVHGRIVASSAADRIGGVLPPAAVWETANLPGGMVTLSLAAGTASARTVQLRSELVSQFTGASLGQLAAHYDWSGIEHMLDAAAQGRRLIVVIDRAGRIAAASRTVRDSLPADFRFDESWQGDGYIGEREAAPLTVGPVMAGRARSPGYDHFSGFGWTTLVLQPLDTALAPVRRMGYVFAALLLVAAMVIAVFASITSSRIARPVVALTEFTRRFRLDQSLEVPPIDAAGEVGELRHAFGQMVSELQQSRQTLVQASKLAAVGEFAAVMAHEIRTPLGILRSSAQMLEKDPSSGDEARELAGFISSETQRLSRLVNAMLDHARVRSPVRIPQSLELLLDRCVSMLSHQAAKQGTTMVREYRASDAVADVDGEQITQVFLNLLMNALQILATGGQITLRTYNEGRRLIVEVSDNGPGIPEAERARIFEPFVFGREGGLGIGLAVVRQIIGAHGGDIVALENPGGGACFRLSLPQRSELMA